MQSFFQFKESRTTLPVSSLLKTSQISLPVNVFTEFGDLKSTLVGYMDDTAFLPECQMSDYESIVLSGGPYPAIIIKKCQEIQEQLAKNLLKRGIEVARPGHVDHSVKIKIASNGTTVETPGFHTFSPRDLVFFYHDTVYFAPPLFISSQSDIAAYKWLAQDLQKLGSTWKKSWKGVYDENTPYWEAANLLRV